MMEEIDVDILSAEITKQGSHVRELKKEGKSAEEISLAVSKLDELKKKFAALSVSSPNENELNRKVFDDLLIRKMFVIPAFEIHGGVKGLFDLGPPSCALKAAMVDIWRKHFVLAESMLEMECSCLTPEAVLKTSGHVERFTDLMVKDPETGECFRADKLLEDAIDRLLQDNKDLNEEQREEHLRIQRQADAFTSTELDELLIKYDCKGPSGNNYSASFPFNLMFKTSIGPEGTAVGYLRPETAQGLFVNFKRLLDLNASKMPFAAAQIGLGFRNEIAPRSGLLRVREFTMAEIEHFVNPNDKSHTNFASVAEKSLVLFGRHDQLNTGKTKALKVQEAVKAGLINNETLAYFMARTQLFMEKIGMNPQKLRFRQHLATEMAHYAADCWDLEINTSYGWVECVGHADRACYDLDVHAKVTKTPMLATQKLDKPQDIQIAKIKLNRKVLGQVFTKEQRAVGNAIEKLAEDWDTFKPFADALESEGSAQVEGYRITKDMITDYKPVKKKVFEIKYTPSVIEPSFGMGRILYALLEHSFYIRGGEDADDEQRCVMGFNAKVAPYKVAILPISSHEHCNLIVDDIAKSLMEEDISVRVDKSSASIGRRYARSDEIGVPYAITVDFDTLQDSTVTLRERDSTSQVRMPQKDVVHVLHHIVSGKLSWEEHILDKMYAKVEAAEESTEKETKENGGIVVEDTGRGKFARPATAIQVP